MNPRNKLFITSIVFSFFVIIEIKLVVGKNWSDTSFSSKTKSDQIMKIFFISGKISSPSHWYPTIFPEIDFSLFKNPEDNYQALWLGYNLYVYTYLFYHKSVLCAGWIYTGF